MYEISCLFYYDFLIQVVCLNRSAKTNLNITKQSNSENAVNRFLHTVHFGRCDFL